MFIIGDEENIISPEGEGDLEVNAKSNELLFLYTQEVQLYNGRENYVIFNKNIYNNILNNIQLKKYFDTTVTPELEKLSIEIILVDEPVDTAPKIKGVKFYTNKRFNEWYLVDTITFRRYVNLDFDTFISDYLKVELSGNFDEGDEAERIRIRIKGKIIPFEHSISKAGGGWTRDV